MTRQELIDTWNSLSTEEACEVLEYNNISLSTIAEVLGKEAVCEYSSWTYANIK